MAANAFRIASTRTSASRGLTLLECMMAVLIIAITLLAISQVDINTVSTAAQAGNMRRAALLANEILTRECLGNFPEEVGVEETDGRQEVDTELYGEEYRGFDYEVTKIIEEIDIETNLSAVETDEWGDPIDDDEPLSGSAEEERREALPKIQVVRIRVTVYYPFIETREDDMAIGGGLDDDELQGSGDVPGELTLETYVRDPFAQDALNPESTEADDTGTTP